jgi:type IV pilus biogenesis protein CpaD/CtpE
MRHAKRITIPLSLVIALLLVGCAAKDPAKVPTPAPIQVANSINVLAQTVDTAATALITARDQGVLSQPDFVIGSKVIVAIATTGKKLNAELLTGESWETQKVKIRQIIVSAGVAEVTKQLPANARQIVSTCLAIFNQISSGVGGPVL